MLFPPQNAKSPTLIGPLHHRSGFNFSTTEAKKYKPNWPDCDVSYKVRARSVYGFVGGLSAFQSFLEHQTMPIITANTGENSTGIETFFAVDALVSRLPMGRSTFLNGVKAGKYPQPVRFSPRRPVWRKSDIDALIASL